MHLSPARKLSQLVDKLVLEYECRKNRFQINQNQRQISRLAKKQHTIWLSPQRPPGGGGGPQNYYHFLFDLLLPLSKILDSDTSGTQYVTAQFGPITRHLEAAFGDAVDTVTPDEFEQQPNSVPILGMNPKVLHVTPAELTQFCESVLDRMSISPSPNRGRILFIERLQGSSSRDGQREQGAKKKGRRSIPNHEELVTLARKIISRDETLESVTLETMAFDEQIKLFSEARVVIAQHGAGLANIVWMPTGGLVLEIDPYRGGRPHFRILSRLKGHKYLTVRSKGEHAEINLQRFSKKLSSLLS